MEYQLRISGSNYLELKQHLLNDEKESVAIGLCGKYQTTDLTILMLYRLRLIPSEDCISRDREHVNWKTEYISDFFEILADTNLSIIKFHSHPNFKKEFSNVDNNSDYNFFISAFGWSKNPDLHASAIMLPNGEIFGRIFDSNLNTIKITKISIIGDTIFQFGDIVNAEFRKSLDFGFRTAQTFGEQTYFKLGTLKVGVVGCSGTGSIVIEQLVRLGIGELVLIDPDKIEAKNLNRILNSKMSHVKDCVFKVFALENAINSFGLNTRVHAFPVNLYDDITVLKSLIECDIIFGCTDNVDSRHLLNQLCSFYLLPYFDVGVKLIADGQGGIDKICGSVHYIQPHKSSLYTRGVYNFEDLRAAGQFRKNQVEFENLRKNAYITNVNVSNPAVISVNMMVASSAINEFLNRIHSFRTEAPCNYSCITIDITESCIINVGESDYKVDDYLNLRCGRGDMTPFLEMPEINEKTHF